MLAATQGLTEAVTSALGAVTEEARENSSPLPPPPREGSPLPPPMPPSPLPPTPPPPSSLPPPRHSIDLPSPPLSISQVKQRRKLIKISNPGQSSPTHPAPTSTTFSNDSRGERATWNLGEESGDSIQEISKVNQQSPNHTHSPISYDTTQVRETVAGKTHKTNNMIMTITITIMKTITIIIMTQVRETVAGNTTKAITT